MNSRKLIAGPLGLLLVLSFAVGCGPKEESLKIAVTASKDGLCSEIAKVVCYNVFHCCTGAQIEDALGLQQTTTEKKCRKDMELICEQNMAPVLHGLNKNTLTVDSAGATTCLESLLPPDDECFPTLTEPEFVPCARTSSSKESRGTGRNASTGRNVRRIITVLRTENAGPFPASRTVATPRPRTNSARKDCTAMRTCCAKS